MTSASWHAPVIEHFACEQCECFQYLLIGMLYYHGTGWNDFGCLNAFVFYCFFLDLINGFPVNSFCAIKHGTLQIY